MARTAALSGSGRVGQAAMISCRSEGLLLPCERGCKRRLFLFNEDGGLVRGSNPPASIRRVRVAHLLMAGQEKQTSEYVECPEQTRLVSAPKGSFLSPRSASQVLLTCAEQSRSMAGHNPPICNTENSFLTDAANALPVPSIAEGSK